MRYAIMANSTCVPKRLEYLLKQINNPARPTTRQILFVGLGPPIQFAIEGILVVGIPTAAFGSRRMVDELRSQL